MVLVLAALGLNFQPIEASYRRTPFEDEKPPVTEKLEKTAGSARAWQVAGWLPTSWDVKYAQQSWEQNQHLLDEINPIWYKMCVGDKNEITKNHGAESEEWLRRFREAGVRIVPMIGNSSNTECLSRVLKFDEERAQHIRDLLAKVDEFGYDGIDIDYEKVDANDRDLFTIFIAELAQKLHERDKILAIAVHPQKTGQEDWDGPGGQDWERLGGLVDEFKIMAYDHHWLSGQPGTIAPLPWVREIVEYARETVPLSKIFLGVPFYGYDWPIDDEGRRVRGSSSRSWRKIQNYLCKKYNCEQIWLAQDKTPLIKYFSEYDHHQHLLYYENARSLSHRLDLVREYGLGGIAIWRMGSEDPDNWKMIAEKLRNQYRHTFDDCREIWFERLLALGRGEKIAEPELITQCHSANKLHERKILAGDGQGNFLPRVPLSRAQLLKIAFVAHAVDEKSVRGLGARVCRQNFSAAPAGDAGRGFENIFRSGWF